MMNLCIMQHNPAGVVRNESSPRARSFSVGSPVQKSKNAVSHRMSFEFNLEDHIQKTRKAAGYLKQIFHTQDCQGSCMAVTCTRIATLLVHVNGCQTMQCINPGCNTTKALLKHARECNAKNIMNPIKDGPFCLMCTIAGSSDGVVQAPNCELNCDSETDERCRPLVCDEMMEFSRVPFQSLKSLTSRAKTFSDSEFVVTANQVNQPNKKARSKSMNAASLEMFQDN